MRPSAQPCAPGRAFVAMVLFMVSFVIVLLMVAYRFLLPAMEVAVDADKTAQKHLAAISSLVLVIVLFCLFSLLLIILRPGRLFLPRQGEQRVKTKYVDAWGESAKRVKVDEDQTQP